MSTFQHLRVFFRTELGLGLGSCSMAKNMAKNAKKAKNMAKKGVGYG